jgi:hypothetical protein
VEDALAFLKENMPKSLYDDIYYEIRYQIRYNDAKDAIECDGIFCFNDMDEDVYDSMRMEELIDRFLNDNIDGIFEFSINSIKLEK